MPEVSQFDHEFLTADSVNAQGEQMAGLVQQNLTPEEQGRLEEILPVLEEFNMLMHKAQTGEFPEGAGETGFINEQGVPESGQRDGRVPQNMENQQRPPLQAVEGQMPQNAPEMMSEGGKVDLSGILEGDKPDWLIRALDPSTPTTKDGETIRSLHTFHDGNWIVFPSIRMKDGKLKQLGEEVPRGYSNPRGISFDKAFNETLNKKDYIVVPARDDKEAEAYSIAISDEISKRRGMQMGGVAAGPVGVVDKQGADDSGVADDVPAESDGFVINAAAVRHAGLRDINDMIQDAKEYAEKQGMKLNFGKTPVDTEKILVSNGEVVIPDVIANIIGYDRLEKINNRGKKETEEKIQQQEQQPPPPQKPTQPVMRAAEGGQMKDLFPAESAIALEELEEVRKSKEPDRELAVRVYEALTVPETGAFEDPFIRTEFIPEEGSTAYGPVQITKGLMEDPRYSDIDDPYESIARQRLINQGEKFARFGNRDWERLLESGEITQKEADEAAALYEYGKSGDYVRDDRDKEDYKRYAVSIINRKLKDLEKEGFKDKEKLEKFLKEWNPKASKKYIKEFFDTFKKNLDN